MSSSRPTKRYLAGRTARRYVCLMFPRCYLKSLMCSTVCGRSNHIFLQGWETNKPPHQGSCRWRQLPCLGHFPFQSSALFRVSNIYLIHFTHKFGLDSGTGLGRLKTDRLQAGNTGENRLIIFFCGRKGMKASERHKQGCRYFNRDPGRNERLIRGCGTEPKYAAIHS